MTKPACPDDEFINLFETLGPHKAARKLGQSTRNVYKRRETLEKKIKRQITPPDRTHATRFQIEHPHRVEYGLENGVVLVGSDAHYFPGHISTAHKAFVKFCKELRPQIVCLNGDVFDGATISRFPPIGWESCPPVADEIEECKARLDEIRHAAKNAKLVWVLGNHDGRFETVLATHAREYAGVHGIHLKDHFPEWEPAWSMWINDDVVVKHRFKGGIHAPHNNTMWSGKTMVTGHLHSLKVIPFSDYNGTRWGVDCGTLSGGGDGPQFVNYLEDNPTNWRCGFVVLTFEDGKLLWPEQVWVREKGVVEFRGEVIDVR